MQLLKYEGLTFDDVLLVPQKTALTSRKQANTATRLTKRLNLNTPIVSANMDTVTEAPMAIAMARLGGIGIIHRYMTIEDEVRQVEKVKRSESIVIDEPYTITPQETIAQAKNLMKRQGVSGLLVINSHKILTGILTTRDIVYVEQPEETRVSQVMTPKEKLVTAKPGIQPEKAKKLLEARRIEKLPLVDDEGRLAGLITVKDIVEKRTLYPLASKDQKGRLLVGAAIGVKGDYLERAEELTGAGCDVLVLDIAHGHATYTLDAIKKLKARLGRETQIIAGNVATYQGAKDLARAGADAIKVGVGPGATCITRVVTGSGVPQLTAIMSAARLTKETGIPIIADGGIRNSGDVTKALAAGASTVMVGSLLAGTEESPGATIIRDGIKHKICRGMASLGAAFGRAKAEGSKLEEEDAADVVAEGVEAVVPYRGQCAETINQLAGGLRSGMSYCGSSTIAEMWKKSVFMKISNASILESRPHDLAKI